MLSDGRFTSHNAAWPVELGFVQATNKLAATSDMERYIACPDCLALSTNAHPTCGALWGGLHPHGHAPLQCTTPIPLSPSLSVAAILADASIRMVALSCLGRMLFWSSVYRAQKMLQSPPLMLYSTSRRRDHPPLRLDVARKMCRRHTNAAKATPRLIKQWCAKDSIYHINRPIALYPQPHAGRLGMCSRNHAFGLPPNPGTPVHLWPAGILGRPKFSSRSRMTLRAFRLRRYGSGAFASARPTDGSRLASPWSLPGSGSAFDASVPSSE
jgi:hypothetical protein